MITQLIKGHDGLPAGVFIPIEDWNKLKSYFPNIEKVDEDLPQWQKDILDERLAEMNNADKIKPVELLLKSLDEESGKLSLKTPANPSNGRGSNAISPGFNGSRNGDISSPFCIKEAWYSKYTIPSRIAKRPTGRPPCPKSKPTLISDTERFIFYYLVYV